jgi:hypothetical protein
VGKLVHQLEKQRLTIDYWRAKYFELRGIMPDDTPKMAGGLPGAFLAQPYTQTTNDPELLLRTSYAFDAVVAYLHGLNLAIPNTFVFNEAKTFDYWELLESSHTLELPSIEKALDIFLHCVVFAHGMYFIIVIRFRAGQKLFWQMAASKVQPVAFSSPLLRPPSA